jgi:hypothetical protein
MLPWRYLHNRNRKLDTSQDVILAMFAPPFEDSVLISSILLSFALRAGGRQSVYGGFLLRGRPVNLVSVSFTEDSSIVFIPITLRER